MGGLRGKVNAPEKARILPTTAAGRQTENGPPGKTPAADPGNIDRFVLRPITMQV